VAEEVLFYRPCKRCKEGFLYCRAREPGRRYCDECVAPAQKERERKARKNYRSSPEGREQHNDEQERWRERQRERVGDRRLEADEGRVEMLGNAAPYERAEEEPGDEPIQAQPTVEPLEWVLVAWPELLAAANRQLGFSVACSGCGRRGVVVRVVPLADWDEEDER
jgi:hypothetical protein